MSDNNSIGRRAFLKATLAAAAATSGAANSGLFLRGASAETREPLSQIIEETEQELWFRNRLPDITVEPLLHTEINEGLIPLSPV